VNNKAIEKRGLVKKTYPFITAPLVVVLPVHKGVLELRQPVVSEVVLPLFKMPHPRFVLPGGGE
jgi:hypothetical protein